MALNSLFCADMPLSNYSLTHQFSVALLITQNIGFHQGILSGG